MNETWMEELHRKHKRIMKQGQFSVSDLNEANTAILTALAKINDIIKETE